MLQNKISNYHRNYYIICFQRARNKNLSQQQKLDKGQQTELFFPLLPLLYLSFCHIDRPEHQLSERYKFVL
jgi:hypothetical protein